MHGPIQGLLRGQVVFISGGGSGVNQGIAKEFARAGAVIGLSGRRADRLETAADELRSLGADVAPVPADVRDLAAVEAALATTEQILGPADTVLCGAAGNFMAPAESSAPGEGRRILRDPTRRLLRTSGIERYLSLCGGAVRALIREAREGSDLDSQEKQCQP